MEKSQGKNIEIGIEVELPACLPAFLSYPSYTAQAHVPGDDTAHSGLCPSTQLAISKTQTCPQANRMDATL